MERKATVYDVAERAGVSIATVSFAFTRPGRVKPETAAAVMAAADELGYVPSASARGLARGRTGAVGIYSFDYLLDDGEERDSADSEQMPTGRLFPLYADEVQRGVQVECRRRGLALMLGGTRGAQHVSQVIEVAGRVDGLIAFAGAVSESALKQVAARIPVVELGGEVRVDGVQTIYVDNRSGMRELGLHLVRDHGYRSFAYFGVQGTPEFRQRLEGIVEALAESGLPAPGLHETKAGDDLSAARVVHSLVERDRMPDAIVCDTDQTALAVMDALRALGRSVPGDVAVTGFDGILAAELSNPPLTTVRQPMEAIGRLAVRLLADALDGVAPHTQVQPLSSPLVIGGSCGCVSVTPERAT